MRLLIHILEGLFILLLWLSVVKKTVVWTTSFLKELHLTEGRNTGSQKIRKTLEYNVSPKPVFKTDDERSYFLTVLHIHPEAQVEAQVDITDTQVKIVPECATDPMSKKEIAEILGHSTVPGNVKKAMTELIDHGLLEYTIPDRPGSKPQRYRTTEKGIEFLRGSIEQPIIHLLNSIRL